MDVKAIENVDAKDQFLKYYLEHFPSAAALKMESFPVEKIIDYLRVVGIEYAQRLLSLMNPDVASRALEKVDHQFFIHLFTGLDTHLGARLLSRLPRAVSETKISVLPSVISRELRDFMNYSPGTAGSLMETNVLSFREDNTVENVLVRLRQLADRRVNIIYVADEDGNLKGSISLQIIAISLPSSRLSELVKPSFSINALASREEVLEVLRSGKLLQVPVTDVHSKLLGVIRNDAIINATRENMAEDLQAMFGAGREEQALSRVSLAVKKRLPWLQVNLATAFLASMVVGLFEETIAQITILAIFLPVVAGQSGNTGSQALAVTMRGLALREIRVSQWFTVARKELLVGFFNGVAVALTTSIIVYFWSGSLGIAIVIAISMVLSMMIAGMAGACIPMALKAVGQDPATSSSIILTTVTDICGFFSFLGLASALAGVLGIV